MYAAVAAAGSKFMPQSNGSAGSQVAAANDPSRLDNASSQPRTQACELGCGHASGIQLPSWL
jgi:hypothetical protein